mmetsp:Transcript_25309/g.83147  ORF Transcript_25309/g.83147 Transcript_25309/m.83147 type:complete len:274 (+) Transcript_25309:293-1114(+)
MCLMEAPTLAITVHKSRIPPGRSGTTTVKRIRRPSFTRARSSTVPSVDVSMLPPQSATATRFPLSSGRRSARIAARPATPAPSCTSFSASSKRRSATLMSRSLTWTSLSMCGASTLKERGPTRGTARPSASVGPFTSTMTGPPAAIAALIDAHAAGSTPMMSMSGLIVLTASAAPAMRPPPPTGMTKASKFSTSSNTSRPIDPAPAMISKSSKPLMYLRSSRSTYSRAAIAASAMVSPFKMTLAPWSRHLEILVNGAMVGMITVTGMPSSRPW